MSGYLESTTAQKVRSFLDSLQVTPSPTASAREIETLLISRVRARRDDPEARQRLRELLADLLTVDSARLPTPDCETLNPAALADELAGLLAERVGASRKARSRPTAALFAVAALLCGAALAANCGEPPKPGCAQDLSGAHFNAMVQGANGLLTADEIKKSEVEYAGLDNQDRARVIAELCGSSAQQISDYLKGPYSSNGLDDDATFPPDVQPSYKGVGF